MDQAEWKLLKEIAELEKTPQGAYNIRRNVWHKIAKSEGSRVLIVENADTHRGDFEFRGLSAQEREELCRRVRDCRNASKH